MKRILIIFEDEVSPFLASFGLSEFLEENGFSIIYACSPSISEHIHANNFNYHIFHCVDLLGIEEELDAFLETYHIDLTLIDLTLTHFAYLLFERNIPFIGLSNELGGVFNCKVPPVFSNLIPQNSRVLSTVLNLLSWTKNYLRYHILLILYVTFHFASKLSLPKQLLINKRLKQSGFQIRWGEYGYKLNIPELKLCIRAFDFPIVSNWNKKYYIGMFPFVNRIANGRAWAEPSPGKPLVYCSLGSHGQHYAKGKRFLLTLLEVFSKNLHWQLIIQINDTGLIADLVAIKPDNVNIYDWLSQKDILARASLFITHGGFGSIKEAIQLKVPMLVCPFHADHYGNAARVQYWSLGKIIDAKASSKQMEKHIKHILCSDQYRFTAEKFYQLSNDQQAHVIDLINDTIASNE
ncbi:Oleandomycin glycosyltransferase [compost metagenome]